MNKSELIARMTDRLEGDRPAAVAAVNGVLEEIEGSVARGERVSLSGFGTFERRERASRVGRNPRTGEAIQVGPSVVPVFRAGTGFRSALSRTGGDPVPAGTAVEAAVPNGSGSKAFAASSAAAGQNGTDAPGGGKKGGKKAKAGAKGAKGARKDKPKADKKSAKSAR